MDYIAIGLSLVVLAIMLFCKTTAVFGQAPAPANARLLTSFTNDDGSKPDGKDDENDDTSAFRKALAAGPGVVYVGAGFYRCSDVTIPANVSVIGAGSATVIRPFGVTSVFVQENVTDWSIRDLLLDGQAKGPWRDRKDEGQSGIRIHKSSSFTISGITVTNFSGAGIQISYTLGPVEGWASRANLDTITATGNYVGVRFDTRAEYINASKFSCQNNVIGCAMYAGNAKLTASNLTSNIDGLHIEDKENGSHGAISNCLLNHNERYALRAVNAANGMTIDNCCFFCGSILLENCKGFVISSGILNCDITTTGKGANRIAGNYIIPDKLTFTFSPATLVQDNFTENGPWEKDTK